MVGFYDHIDLGFLAGVLTTLILIMIIEMTWGITVAELTFFVAIYAGTSPLTIMIFLSIAVFLILRLAGRI